MSLEHAPQRDGRKARAPSELVDEFLTERSAAEFLNVSVRSVQRWRYEGGGPDFCRFGKAVRYPKSALVRYVELTLRRQSSESGRA